MAGLRGVGAVRFDHEDPSQGGWACVQGGRPFRISTVGNLDNQTLWCMNLPFATFNGNGLNRTSHFKRTTYLNSWQNGGQKEIAQGWGLLPRNYSEAEICYGLASIFGNAFGFASAHYGIDMAKGAPIYDALSDEIRAKVMPIKDKRLGPEIDGAVHAAHQYFTHCVIGPMRRDEYVDVRFTAPAVEYAKQMLDIPIPGEQVSFVEEAGLPPAADRVRWVLEQEQPVLARVIVSDVSPDVAPLIAHGSGAKSGCVRQWVSQPELLLLSRYARVHVDAAFVFREYEALPARCALPLMTGLQAMTPSAELIAMNHWTSLCRENPWRMDQVPATERGLAPRAAWMTAIDRFTMFTYALQLHRAGLIVKLYGAGAVVVAVPKYAYREAYEIAARVGLLAPTQISSDIDMQMDLQYGMESHEQVAGHGSAVDLSASLQDGVAKTLGGAGKHAHALSVILRDTRNLDQIMALDRLLLLPSTPDAVKQTMRDLEVVRGFITSRLPESVKPAAAALFVEHTAALEAHVLRIRGGQSTQRTLA